MVKYSVKVGIEREDYKLLLRIAKQKRLSISSVVRIALIEYFKKLKSQEPELFKTEKEEEIE
jgi:hypothetical protein